MIIGMPNPTDAQREGVSAWAALLRCHAALVPILSQQVQSQVGLPLSWYDVLLELQAADGQQLRLQELGNRVVLSRSRVSRVVDEMTNAGLVRREADPQDGRAAFAVLTQDGEAAFRRAAPVYMAAIDRHFTTHLSATERRSIARGLNNVVGSL